MMGFWQPGTNLRDYVSQNPPLVTFFLCLLTLAISFICFSSYSYTHTVPNPDTVKDWNHLLSSFSQHKLCVQANASLSELVPLSVTTNSNSGSLKNLALHTAFKASQLHLGGTESVDVTLEFWTENESYTCLTIRAPAHLLPMKLFPPECPEFKKNISPLHVEVSDKKPAASQTCYSLHSQDDPTLTVMLTQEERNVAEPLMDT
ncbi:Transmembrane protein 248 [Dissostichus eleginoides]|uniref:Transmembrane protein 248 n=1 Tax=Dissostichus eleginoides TaxID=100907 RepID=A0AAD9C1H2_DISEL|nr:Transmembrane protein 248 [Dissostichus eleginoides]